jgi:hypothetical protein
MIEQRLGFLPNDRAEDEAETEEERATEGASNPQTAAAAA